MPRREAAPSWQQRCARRARPLLGTLVMLQLEAAQDAPDMAGLHAACDAAFAAIARIDHVMSAHRPDSDLGRLARAAPGDVLVLDPHTVAVLRAARQWHRTSGGAFDPARAARMLAACGLRPAFAGCSGAVGGLHDLTLIDASHVRVAAPLRLDLGGIAKGYAVDVAVQTLRERGINSALVNAGGDLRAIGPRRWPIERRQRASARHGARAPLYLRHAALATSETGRPESEFVPSLRAASSKVARCCSIEAPLCMNADALTKWALQTGPASPRLRRALRTARASLWVSPS